MSKLELPQILREEIESIDLARDSGNAEAGGRLDFAHRYRQWMLQEAKQKSASLLKQDHILKLEEFVVTLGTGESRSFGSLLADQLPKPLVERIRNKAQHLAEVESVEARKKAWKESDRRALLADLVSEINKLIDQEAGLFTKDKVELFELDEHCRELFKSSQSPRKQMALNRLLLQQAFPDEIAKIWDTLSGLQAWNLSQRRSALCLSGGGIRSATFGLGVLQSLARHDLLDKFDYLSTVSGGGYIGSWLSAWARHESFEAVNKALRADWTRDPLQTEPVPLRHLREFSNYLTPKLGLTSADTWTLITIYLRNVFLNWIVFIPALAAILALPRLCITLLNWKIPPTGFFLAFGLGVLLSIWALVSAAGQRLARQEVEHEHDGGTAKSYKHDRFHFIEKWGKNKFLWLCLTPLWFAGVCFSSVWGWLQINSYDEVPILDKLGPPNMPTWWAFVLFGAGIHFIACLCYFPKIRRSAYQQHRWYEFFTCLISGGVGGLLLLCGAKLSFTQFGFAPDLEWYVCLATPYFLLSFLVAGALFVGLNSWRTGDLEREWWARMGAWVFIALGAWTLFSVLSLFGPEGLMKLPKLLGSLGGISGITALLLAHSGSTAADKSKTPNVKGTKKYASLALGIAAPLFVAALIGAISLGTTWLASLKWLHTETELNGAANFTKDDIQDMPALALKLKKQLDPVSDYLWGLLSPELQQRMLACKECELDKKTLKARLAEEINGLVQQGNLYDRIVFTNISLSEETQAALILDLKGEQLAQRNRLLLEDAYPSAIWPRRFDHLMITHQSAWQSVLILIVGLGGLSFVLSRAINVNKFSLHAVYRDRLIRAYLGASNRNRKPDPFSGFDPKDNMHLVELRHRPFHVINMALNLVQNGNLAWQQRKAESFTASPLHAGSYHLGYRMVQEYGSWTPRFCVSFEKAAAQSAKPVDGLTLGTAVAISGAAASPNMGYHSSPVMAALMTLFNVRLGAWLGNPGEKGETTYKLPAPKSAFLHLAYEALGLTNASSEFVYLSDGGHFENLGLYEMVLRRCKYIVVSDAGADPKCALEDLGNAIRKIRIDLGISIKFDHFDIFSRKSGKQSKYCAIGKIKYFEVDAMGDQDAVPDGTLIYIKPAIAKDIPKDVFNYKKSSETFPHESTSDQWFSESQFESYRALGQHIVDTICKEPPEASAPEPAAPERPKPPADLSEFVGQVRSYLNPLPAAQATPATPATTAASAAPPAK